MDEYESQSKTRHFRTPASFPTAQLSLTDFLCEGASESRKSRDCYGGSDGSRTPRTVQSNDATLSMRFGQKTSPKSTVRAPTSAPVNNAQATHCHSTLTKRHTGAQKRGETDTRVAHASTSLDHSNTALSSRSEALSGDAPDAFFKGALAEAFQSKCWSKRHAKPHCT